MSSRPYEFLYRYENLEDDDLERDAININTNLKTRWEKFVDKDSSEDEFQEQEQSLSQSIGLFKILKKKLSSSDLHNKMKRSEKSSTSKSNSKISGSKAYKIDI